MTVKEGNSANVIYLSGNEFADGSVRVEPADFHIGVPHIEVRRNGIWRNTGLALDAESLFLGNDVSIGTVGSHLQINSEEGDRKSILLETVFNDGGSGLPHTHVLGPRFNHVVFSANEIGEIVTDNFELPVTSFLTAFRYTYYFKTGSVAATSPVTMQLSKGSVAGGKVILEVVMDADDWAAGVEVVIPLVGGLQLSIGAPLLLTIFSDNDFSLIGDEANGGNFFASDFQTFFLEDVISTPTGTDRFDFSCKTGEMSIGVDGNPTIAGSQGSLSQADPPTAFPPLSDPPPLGI